MSDTLAKNDLTPQKVIEKISCIVNSADNKLDLLTTFLSPNANDFEHTGT